MIRELKGSLKLIRLKESRNQFHSILTDLTEMLISFHEKIQTNSCFNLLKEEKKMFIKFVFIFIIHLNV